jgi:hypothetical protein
MALIDLKKATIEVSNGTTTIEVKIGEGNLTYTEKRNIQYIKDKGLLDTTREGDEEPVEARMDFYWEYVIGSTTMEGVVKGTPGQTGGSGPECEPYACDIDITFDPGCSITATAITLDEYRWESFEHDLRAGMVATSGQCNITRATYV